MNKEFYYYKIEDKQVLAQFHGAIDRKHAIIERMLKLANDLGFDSCVGDHSRTYGICLQAFTKPTTANLQFYKTRIGKNRETQYIPKKSCRAFYNSIKDEFEYLNGYGSLKVPFSYDEIDTLIVKNNNRGWDSVRPIIEYSNDVIIFKVKGNPVEIYDHTVEIKASEYYRISEEIEEADNGANE